MDPQRAKCELPVVSKIPGVAGTASVSMGYRKIRQRHICFVAPTAYPVLSSACNGLCGGAEVQQYLLIKALLAEDCRVTVLVADCGQPALEVREHIEVIKGPFRYLGGSKVYLLVDTIRLACLLNDIAAAVNVFRVPPLLILPMAVHRCVFGGRLIHQVASDRECTDTRSAIRILTRLLGRRALDCTVFQTYFQRDAARRTQGLTGVVIRSIAHGVPEPVDFRDKDIDVLWVGSCVRGKQPDMLLRLAAALPDIRFTMIMANGLDKRYQDQIEREARALANLTYAGFVPYSQIGAYYRRAKLLVSTSASEGFPNIFLQAWQASASVASLTVDPDGIVSEKRLGTVSGSEDCLRRDVRRLLIDEDHWNLLTRNGREYVRQHHSPRAIATAYLKLFDELGG